MAPVGPVTGERVSPPLSKPTEVYRTAGIAIQTDYQRRPTRPLRRALSQNCSTAVGGRPRRP